MASGFPGAQEHKVFGQNKIHIPDHVLTVSLLIEAHSLLFPAEMNLTMHHADL